MPLSQNGYGSCIWAWEVTLGDQLEPAFLELGAAPGLEGYSGLGKLMWDADARCCQAYKGEPMERPPTKHAIPRKYTIHALKHTLHTQLRITIK